MSCRMLTAGIGLGGGLGLGGIGAVLAFVGILLGFLGAGAGLLASDAWTYAAGPHPGWESYAFVPAAAEYLAAIVMGTIAALLGLTGGVSFIGGAAGIGVGTTMIAASVLTVASAPTSPPALPETPEHQSARR